MSLFGKLGGAKEVSLEPLGALLLAAITMTAADGDIEDDEVAIIRRLDQGEESRQWNEAIKVWKDKTFDECIDIVTRSLNSEQKLSTMANLIDIAMADGSLAGKEKDLLEAYMDAFQLDPNDVEKIVDVISIKNGRSAF